MKPLLVTALCAITSTVFSQCPTVNAISNGSFENYNSCTAGASAMALAIGWIQASPSGTSDYYNCSFYL